MSWEQEADIASGFVKETSIDSLYDLREDAETVWDDSVTFWDVDGNVERTEWDTSDLIPAWSKESGI